MDYGKVMDYYQKIVDALGTDTLCQEMVNYLGWNEYTLEMLQEIAKANGVDDEIEAEETD